MHDEASDRGTHTYRQVIRPSRAFFLLARPTQNTDQLPSSIGERDVFFSEDEALDALDLAAVSYQIVLTKADKLNRKEQAESLRAARAVLAEAGIDTIIDLGRLATPLTSTPHLIATPIIDDADMILVMIEATLRDVAGAHTMVEGLAEQMNLAGAHQRLGLLVHRGGAARGVAEFTDKEITSALQLPVCGSIVHDPVAAAQLSDGVGQRFDKSRLARSLSKVAGVLVDVIGRRRADSKEDL